MSHFSDIIFKRTYAFSDGEDWFGCAARVSKFVANGDKKLEKEFFDVISTKRFIPGGRYLYSSGRNIPQITNCFLLRAEDSRQGWGKLLDKHATALSTGGGVGTEYSEIREKGAPIKGYGGVASGPVSLMAMVNEVARHIMAGGKRRSALWAGLSWQHPDIEQFIHAKDWDTAIRAFKEKDFNFPALLDMTNISVCLDNDFFHTIENEKDDKTWDFYYRICKQMCKTGEPGFSINVDAHSKEILRNPCTEVVSETDSDCCNLGSVNFGKIKDLDELDYITRVAVKFLYNGTFIGWMPHPDFERVRNENHRVGLGLMGLHEWCIKHEQRYEPSHKLRKWLSDWRAISNEEAKTYANGSTPPIAVRAIAPTGTIAIIGETTSGIEPIHCVAYKRRFLDTDGKWKYSFVIDPTAERFIQQGIRPDDIEDSLSLSKDVERRIRMQAFVQEFVDQAISSTINLPEWGEYGNNNAKRFAETLLTYLPKLRGITVYPDGSRSGQPITPVKYETAKKHTEVVFQEETERCDGGVCGL